jgi:hypothetical protein
MAVLAVQVFSRDTPAQISPAATLVADQDLLMSGSANIALLVYNGDGSSIVVTVEGQGLCEYGVAHDLVVTIPTHQWFLFPPLTPARFQEPTAKTVKVTATGTLTTSTISALQVK